MALLQTGEEGASLFSSELTRHANVSNAFSGKDKRLQAMASYNPKLLEKKYNNWVKAQLAVLLTKEGVEHFNAHRYYGPSYKNSDATQWCSNFWEIAKCFMPPDGYKEKASATETDFNGIISVILNHKDFQGKVLENLNTKTNKFAELENDTLVIGKDDIRKVLDDVATAIQDKMKAGLDEQYDKIKLDMIRRKQEDLKSLESKTFEGMTQIQDETDASMKRLNKERDKEVDTIHEQGDKERAGLTEIGNMLQKELKTTSKAEKEEKYLSLGSKTAEGMTKIQDETDASVKRLNDERVKEVNTIHKHGDKKRKELTELGETLQKKLETASKAEKEEQYFDSKQKLQGDLIKFYRKRCSSIPLSPLLEEIETPLAGFYVMPEIVAVKQKSLTCHEEEKTPIKSMKDLFSTGSGDQQEIYLSADAGFGKTAFSKYLAIMWCQAHCHDENYACFKKEELKTLFDFDFLFLVSLRDCTSVCNIDDMIEQLITKKLPSSTSLDEVLRREKCLIILDGLDEWTHPANSCGEVSEKIPHRYVRDNCVILTTTRPWKLGVSNLKTSQINKKVELVQLSADSTRQLEENAIRKMTGVKNDRVLKNKRRDFNKVIRDRRLKHMQVIPLLLMYIVCLWCNNIPIGNSKHEIYTNIIEFLLSRTSKKHPEVQPSRESSASEIPEYFKSHEFCKHFYSLITSLAELAYQTLFHENRENTLVFDRTVAEKYLKADDMKLSLLSGILSESRSKTLIKEIIKVSFSHKTVQEYFAAIFISSQSDAQKTVVEKCRNVQDILDMSKICEFISKMNADLMCAISNDLMSVINEDEKTRDYRTRTVTSTCSIIHCITYRKCSCRVYKKCLKVKIFNYVYKISSFTGTPMCTVSSYNVY
ncbi:uncharacterized protein LOC132739908 [Ruditapes philippinarum]|uniref:uncharacterized protein LOC132739908 n=1 Tax=Ruditapes philippinarum TaxID=129788 RepID=UPI00295ADC6F|nr:uncharacterized protein LOC132739908 [Ruditapes philippinarum]